MIAIGNVTVHHGNCLDILPTLPDCSVDSVVTDPPYGLSNQPDMMEVLKHWMNGDDYQHNGSGFMGKTWDSFVPGPAVWREVFRVLKPGGHLLSFGGTRTYDMMVLAIRLAGFEIRDSIVYWHYATGFPKSLDVSKAIDKAAGAEREVVGAQPYTSAKMKAGDCHVGNHNAERIVGDITTAATDAAKQWEGWGTALKPAVEPVVVARRPLIGTVAANVLQYGTGALNIDGTRVPNTGESIQRVTGKGTLGGTSDGYDRPWKNDPEAIAARQERADIAIDKANTLGRWPANVIFDPDAATELDRQSGVSKAGAPRSDRDTGGIWAEGNGIPVGPQYGDTGGASRFFYIAKPSKAERTCNGTVTNGHPTLKPLTLMRYLVRLVTPPGGTVLEPFAGSGTTLMAATMEGFNSIGIEMTDDYLPIIEGRVRWAQQKTTQKELF
jgi:DNA modification methylase